MVRAVDLAVKGVLSTGTPRPSSGSPLDLGAQIVLQTALGSFSRWGMLARQRGRTARPGLVLGYAASSPTDISEGVAALGAGLRRQS